jgi:hypothetical protein
LKKSELLFLEKVFAANLDGRLLQSKSKVAKKLEEAGYIVFTEKTLGRDRFGSIVVDGYTLTVMGNMAYCTSDRCKEPVEEQ